MDRLRARGRWPWLFSEELRSRFDVVSWDQRGVSRSAAVRCFAGVLPPVGTGCSRAASPFDQPAGR